MFVCCPTKYDIIKYAKIPPIEKRPLESTAVFPASTPRAIFLVAQ